MQILVSESKAIDIARKPLPRLMEAPYDKTSGSVEKQRKQLPRKRIDTSFREEDYLCFKFFYGDVLAEWEKDEKYNMYRLLLRGVRDHRFICRINVSEKVFSHIPMDMKIKGAFNCKIVFLAAMEKYKNYMKCSLRWSDYLHIKPI